jgi:hypothetical protein
MAGSRASCAHHAGRRGNVLIHGSCHCGNIALTLEWEGEAPQIAARVCTCSFCVKHGGVWTSDPAATLKVTVADSLRVSEYEFGTKTATFHVCARCGAVPLVTSKIGGHLYAVVNVNALEGIDLASIRRATADFAGEDVESRLARRRRNWIGDVRFAGRD